MGRVSASVRYQLRKVRTAPQSEAALETGDAGRGGDPLLAGLCNQQGRFWPRSGPFLVLIVTMPSPQRRPS